MARAGASNIARQGECIVLAVYYLYTSDRALALRVRGLRQCFKSRDRFGFSGFGARRHCYNRASTPLSSIAFL